MKICNKCDEEKELDQFNRSSRSVDGADTICKQCYTIRKRKWHKSDLGQNAYIKARERALARKRRAIDYMGGKCTDCGGEFHMSCYEFHHIDPSEKDNPPATMKNYSWEKYKAELDKCVMLCANCHRIRHWGAAVS